MVVLSGKINLYYGWIAIQNRDIKKAQKELKEAHDALQNHILYHPMCHMMLAVSHIPHPIRMTREVYLGIMAPWASLRRNLRSKTATNLKNFC